MVEQLTTDEAILLTAGVGFWHTHAVPRLGIPAIKVTDGPNGMQAYKLTTCAWLITSCEPPTQARAATTSS